jgi:hypothetical protein
MDEVLALLEWPAMAITLAAAWWMGSQRATRRILAFSLLIVGNLLWIGWGWGESAWALIALNLGLLGLNVRGIAKNDAAKS